MRIVSPVWSRSDPFETLREAVGSWGLEHGYNDLHASRANVEARTTGDLRLAEEREHGRLGVPPDVIERQVAGLERALSAWRGETRPGLSPAQAGGVAIVPALAAMGLPRMAIIATPPTVLAIASLTAVAFVLLAARHSVRGSWLRIRVAIAEWRFGRAERRYAFADAWVGIRLAPLMATYDIEIARGRQAKRLEAVGSRTFEGGL